MAVNLHSDHIIRHLRRPGDTRHYIPCGGMFRYVSSANYFGELLEWMGFAVASWSWAGAVFVVVDLRQPRAARRHRSTNATSRSSARSSPRCTANASFLSSIDSMKKESLLFTPYKLGPVTLRNRTIRSAAFESMGRAYGPTRAAEGLPRERRPRRRGNDHTGLRRRLSQRAVIRTSSCGCDPKSSRDCATSPKPSTAKEPPHRSRSAIAAT